MERGKGTSKRGPKGKTLAPPGVFIALGSKSARVGSTEASDSKLASTKSGHGLSLAGSSSDRKREAASTSPSSLSIPAKKSKLSGSYPISGSLIRSSSVKKDKDIKKGDQWDSLAIEVDSQNLISQVLEAEDNTDEERVEGLLCGAVKNLRQTRLKPEPSLYISLMYLAKVKPYLFFTENLVEAFSSLLKRGDVTLNFKTKSNSLVSVLAANILMSVHQDEKNWPDIFVKAYLEDAIGERVWIDHEDCRGFVDNIVTAFNTKIPSKHLMPHEFGFKPDVCPSPSSLEDDDTTESATSSNSRDKLDISVQNRYSHLQDALEQHVLEMIRDQFQRRQPMDSISRNMLRLLSSTCGYSEIRLMVAQRLEMWLQNSKLMKPSQELLMYVCHNCNQQNQQDIEVISHLIKIRLKTKPLINYYLICIKELLNQHSDNLGTLLKHTIYNELSNSRNPNNMSLLGVMFQHSPEAAAKLLAEVFQDLLANRDDYLRALRALFREIVRSLRYDLNFVAFCLGLMQERKDPLFRDLETQIKERMFLSIADLITLSIFMSITPGVREAASAYARGDKKDINTLRTFQQQVAIIQRDAVWWLHVVSPKMYKPGRNEFVHCLHKVLLMEQAEHYYNKDNWPPENDRLMMLRLSSEIPVLEDTLMRILIIGLSKEHPLNAPDAHELADQLVKRAAALYAEDFQVINVDRMELIDALFNLCAYHHPENISLPPGYQPPSLAISSLYWKSWIMLLIITAHNPTSFGFAAWDSYPTLRGFIEMCITNHFIFPPPTMAIGDKAEEIKNHELQVSHMEKQEILEFENHLASASTKVTITESNSLLLPQLTTMDPSGLARRPPSQILEQLKLVNQNLKLGHLLCRSRNPDFLLEIIQRQGTSQSMPWLADLVESSEGAFNVLPVQCLCEFLLNDPPEICKTQTESDKEDNKDGKEESKAEKAEKAKKKEKQQKQQQLLKHLQNLLYDSGDDSRSTQEVLDYFLRRLSSQQSTARMQATMGLTMVLCPTIRLDEEDDDELHTEKEEKLEYNWLIKYLPNLPHFDSIRASASVALRQACQIETNPWAVSAYIQFLSNFAPDEQLQESADLALNMAQLIIERTTILNYILPNEEASPREQKTNSLQALMTIFLKYLRKAREPSKEAYSWSESQDQIIIQWASGEAATMHILVVHAMVILLTYGPPQDPKLFDELLEIWFPSTFDPPQAFLVDTSEEALLLPDWLKLRMIRSNVSILVDAALKDLEPTQLVLFIQSFGIPVSSVSKLLQALDFAVECNRYAVDQAVGDKGYMSQLVEVQQQRGAEGGHIFAQLLEVGALPPEDESISGPRREPLIIPTKPAAHITSEAHPNSIFYIFSLDPSCQLTSIKQQELFRPLQKILSLESRSVEKLMTSSVLRILDQLITSREGYLYVKTFHKSATIACPLFRILLISLQKDEGLLRLDLIAIADKILSLSSGLKSPLTKLLEQIKMFGKNSKKPEERQKIMEEKPELSEEYIIREIQKAAQMNKSHLEHVVSRFMDHGMKSKSTKPLVAALTKLLLQNCDNRMTPVSLFVDWLELLEPEIIQSVPHLQQQLLFAHQFSNSDKRHSENVRSFRPYLLALLTHRASWETLHQCINLTLEKSSFDPVAVLDFLWACIYIPKIWQGRDKHLPKHYVEECLLRLTKQQAVRVVDYILAEALYVNGRRDNNEMEMSDKSITPGEPRRDLELEKSHSLQAAYVKSLEPRLPLLLHCSRDYPEIIEAIADHLMSIIDTNKSQNLPAYCLLQLLYLEVPQFMNWISNPNKILKDTQISQKSSSKMDIISHTLLSTLSSNESGKDWNDKMEDIDLACRKLASTHPILLLRQLPMLAASLRGRVQLDFHVFKDRHHLTYFNRVLGLLELLQPHLFKKEYSPSLENTLESYFDLIKNHGAQQKELGGIINRFLILLHNFIAEESQRAVRYIQKHSHILHDLSSIYPDLQSLRSLLAGISLPCHGERDELDEDLEPTLLSFTLSQIPPTRIQAQLAPLLSKLTQRDSVEETLGALQELDALSQRKPEYLEYFVDDLKLFLMDSRESCRNISHNLILRYIKLKPRSAEAFLNSFLGCLESDQQDVVIAALERLGEFAMLSQENAGILLQKAFSVGISTCINTLPFITETMTLLNMQSGS